uniref:Uncharacterized protein n=1 Tax=Oryza sativa subsp. japonica TaxID=39947 RepID=Q6YY19_ORYSJ|nr:hypothetical protein [Oryza sativa Japonica Group]
MGEAMVPPGSARYAIGSGVSSVEMMDVGVVGLRTTVIGEVTGDVENNDADTWQSPKKPSATTMDGHVLVLPPPLAMASGSTVRFVSNGDGGGTNATFGRFEFRDRWI